MAKPKNDPKFTPPVIAGAPVQTVAITVIRGMDAAPETVEVDLPQGETLADKRLVVALVGVNHTGGAVGPQEVVLDVAADPVTSIEVDGGAGG